MKTAAGHTEQLDPVVTSAIRTLYRGGLIELDGNPELAGVIGGPRDIELEDERRRWRERVPKS
jgi:hypothetical protein